MNSNVIPEQSYTRAWSDGRGEVKFFTRSDGSRLRYFTAGTGPPLVLLHTVRTQLDYFQRVIPLLWDSFTVYALDLPGMGWSDIAAGASYAAPDLRTAVVEFVTASDLREVTLAGESLGAALALSASVELTAVSCPTTVWCAAVGFEGSVQLWSGGTWRVVSAPPVPTGTQLTSIACTTVVACRAANLNAIAQRG